MQTLHILAAATQEAAQEQDFLGALGIDLRLLLLQGIAFLILVWFLHKFVYPILIRAIDDRQSKIEEGTKAAAAAEAKAAKAEADVNKMFKEARSEAEAIVATAHKEAVSMVEDAENKAKKRADHIVSEAKAQLDQDVAAARIALKSETAELVALATEAIVKEKVDTKHDASLIERALKEAR